MMLSDFGRMFSVGTIHFEDIVPAKQGGIYRGRWVGHSHAHGGCLGWLLVGTDWTTLTGPFLTLLT